MHAAGIIATLLAATSVSANRLDNAERYAVCPENYDTYCCMTVVPHSVSCRNRRCKDELGWSCIYGLGKVDSIKTCLQDAAHAGRVSAYCKRPGFEYVFPQKGWLTCPAGKASNIIQNKQVLWIGTRMDRRLFRPDAEALRLPKLA